MLRLFLAASVSTVLIAALTSQEPALVAPTEALTPAQERAKFHLPSGWEAQLVAAEPDINKPMNLNFDAQGRLWITDSVEYPFPAQEGQGRDTVKVLSNFGPDGRARKIVTFADKLNIPIGILPLKGRTIVYSIPTIWEMKDTDGDGKADVREPLLTGFGYRDTHGMTNSFTYWIDGWIYACHGFANDSSIKGRDGSMIKLNSGNTYRFRPNGTLVEQFTWGQVNPFGLAFDKWGNLFSADCHSKPVTLLLRGGCYQSFGKPHDGLGFVPDICKHDHGSTGICGIVCLETDTVPPDFRGNFLLGNVVTNRINRDSVVWDGDIKELKEEPDFLKSDDPWFRPVDFKLGPDGAIYVADFYNCIIGHYEVDLRHPRRDRTRGRIWRFVYNGKDATPCGDPNKDWTKATTKELLEALGNPNLALRTLATHEIVERGKNETLKEGLARDCETILEKRKNSLACAHAVWVLERLETSKAIVPLAREGDELMRAHAIQAEATRDSVVSNAGPIDDPSPTVRRFSWTWCFSGLNGSATDPNRILQVAALPRDSITRHFAKIACRAQWLRDERSFGHSIPSHYDAFTAEVALGVPRADAAAQLLRLLDADKVPADLRLDAFRHVGRYAAESELARLPELLCKQTRGENQLQSLKALRQGCQARGAALSKELTAFAVSRTVNLLDSNVPLACRWADELQLKELSPQLAAIGEDCQQTHPNRLAAAVALAHLREAKAIGILHSLWSLAETSLDHRQIIIDAVAGISSPDARKELGEWLVASPSELQRRVALGLATSRDGVEQLLQTIEEGKASPRLLEDQQLIHKVKSAGIRNLEPRLASIMQGLAPPDAKIRQLFTERTAEFARVKPDLAIGKLVFEKHCSACHQLGGQGAKIGPQLDGIGIRGADRLIEDILDPSRNVDQAFRTTLLALDDGKLISGLLLREEGETIVMADEKGKEVRVPKSKVEQRKLLPTSPMPVNLGDQITAEEFPHLIGYLISLRGNAK
jgi:putative heme-binding domain-containing protein